MSDESDILTNSDGLEGGSISDEAYEDDIDTQSGIFSTPEPVLPLAVQQAIRDSYRQCWSEFYEDEHVLCLQALAQLACVDAAHDTELQSIIRITDTEAASTLSAHPVVYVVTDFVSSDTVQVQHRSVEGRLRPLPTCSPGPRYHACTPADAYMYKDDKRYILESIRYGGVRVPGFDERAYMRLFRSVAWQTSFQDPDYYLIAKETIHRVRALEQGQGVINDGEPIKPSLEDLAALNIFPPMNTGIFRSEMDRILDVIHRASQRYAVSTYTVEWMQT
ncbi:hypothetical protein EIP86_001549 [Pleurotus ostreatoroseus]|nr:hypothetical protein EIP86_001549 [Pleurotus ostreatoroseus]